MMQNKPARRELYAVHQRGSCVWQVKRSGRPISYHRCKFDAINFAMAHSNARAVILVVPEAEEGEMMRRRQARRARQAAQVHAEVDRKEREHEAAISLPAAESNEPVEKNLVKASADEVAPRPE
ncbi:MAG TPA: hypothetical protein VEK08_17500 [Planctomycetota bacterium]|nr:hypothetical protein [Planctomycetota bacterium]